MGRGVDGVALQSGAPGKAGLLEGLLRIRAGAGRDEAQLGLDVSALDGEGLDQLVMLRGPCAVGSDEVGEQVKAAGLRLNGDPPAAANWTAESGAATLPTPLTAPAAWPRPARRAAAMPEKSGASTP